MRGERRKSCRRQRQQLPPGVVVVDEWCPGCGEFGHTVAICPTQYQGEEWAAQASQDQVPRGRPQKRELPAAATKRESSLDAILRAVMHNCWRPICGIDTSNATKAILFPKDRKIARNGSAVYFCCVAGKDELVTRMSVHNKNYFLIQISQRTQAIKVEYDLPVSYGNDIDCIATKTKADPSILFFINPPGVPNNLTCETRDMKEVVCTWRTWQEAKNNNPYTETIYSLYEGLLQKVGKCQKESCSFKVTPGQNVYNITVKAKNKVGKAAAHLNMDITHRVYPVDLSEVSNNGVGPRTVNLSWFLKANYSSLGLVCQTNITTDNGNQKLNHSFEGRLDNHSYTVTVDGLHPYTNYAVSIHCASEHFWKWNSWSKAFSFITEQDAPSVGPDVWRQIKKSPQGRSVTLYWKYSTNSETNGPVLFYNITRTSQGRSTQMEPVVGVNWKEFSIDHNAHTITVRAVNSAGGSPTSILNIPADIGMAEENIEAKQINGNAEGFIITWQQDLEVTCGYTVEWCDQVGAKTCDLQWKKFPSHTNSAFITSATFTAGKRYTFNVYVCKSDGDSLFEKKTSKTVQSTEPEDCTYCKIEIVESKKEKEELLPTPSSEFKPEKEFTVSHTAWTYCLNKPPTPGEKENTDFKDLKGSVEFANLSYFPDQNLLGSQESDPQHASTPTNLSPIKMAIATMDYVSNTS
ncbi:UNVERIFIED_CONTAM: hypothetical protein FKN15_005569 [Acipenser sinensis]